MNKPKQLWLNADLGESFGVWNMGQDELIMPVIDCANVATGFHASDTVTMRRTVELAVRHQVKIGAHPAYPDKEGFGRRSMSLSTEEITNAVLYQVGALHAICVAAGTQVSYVKPHGALYNDMMKSTDIFTAILRAVAAFNPNLPLVLLAHPQLAEYEAIAAEEGVTLWPEAFADRAYDNHGYLVPRSESQSVFHERAKILAQAEMIATQGAVRSIDGHRIEIPAVTLCVHGDNEDAVYTSAAIRAMLNERGI
ncbi:UPF0271 protein [Idiomarinaceae bacterium HL-53]|nr:UPF0271 protein [Idiomarinaceae bacterium HL-53]